jgi:hypothetical protein
MAPAVAGEKPPNSALRGWQKTDARIRMSVGNCTVSPSRAHNAKAGDKR